MARIAEIYSQVHKHPIVVKDLARWNATLLMPTPLPQYNIVSKTDPITKLAWDSALLLSPAPGGMATA